MKNIPFFVIITSVLCLSCNESGKGTEKIPVSDTVKEVVSDDHNARNSLDYVGTYNGVLPCGDCEGIETEIILENDGTYLQKLNYLGKGDKKVYEKKGNYGWKEDGSTLILKGSDPEFYFVGENTLTCLDEEGNEITGSSAALYVLRKKAP